MTDTVPPAWSDDVSLGSKLAHDLKGPIAVIRAHARMLIEGLKGTLGEEQRRSVLAIERQANKLMRLVGELDCDQNHTLGCMSTDPSEPALEVSPELPAVLIADDDEETLAVLEQILGGRYQLTFARDGGEALACLRSQPFHLSILDVNLPVLDGFALTQALRASSEHDPPALMFLSGQASPQTKVRALSLGATDYVTKPFDADELAARVARIAAMVIRERSLRADALTDALTGLANYRSFSEGLAREVERSRRYAQPLSLLTLDLDYLKSINDDHGHGAGNEALCAVARVLKGGVRSFDLVSRQGGDEFAVLLPNTSAAEARRLAERLRGEIGRQSVSGRRLTCSIGVAARDDAGNFDAAGLVKASDDALYRAKREGRDRVV